MVGERGFEPPTPWSRTRCSTRLSHSPNLGYDSRALSRSGLVSIGKEARARLSVPEIIHALPARPPVPQAWNRSFFIYLPRIIDV